VRKKLLTVPSVVIALPYKCVILLTYLLTPWCRVLLEKLTGLQLVKKFPAFHGTRVFITALTSVRHLSLSWASPIQSIYPHPISWKSVLILAYKCVILLLLKSNVAIVPYCPGIWPTYTYECMAKVSYQGQHLKEQQHFLVVRPAHAVTKATIQVFYTSITRIMLL